MRTIVSILLLICGVGLCLFHSVTSAVVSSRSIKIYRDQIDSTPLRESYTRAEVGEAAWQAWTNRMRLPVQDSYNVPELKEVILGFGTNRDSFDRATFQTVVARASGYKQDDGSISFVFGIMAMLAGAFLLGGVMFPAKDRKSV